MTNKTTVRGNDSAHFDALPVAAFVTDAKGAITAFNAAAEELTGRPASRTTGKRAWSAFYSRRKANPVDQAMADAESVRERIVIEGPSGPLKVWVEANPTLDAEGEVVSVVCTLVSAENEMEEETEQRLADLEGQYAAINRSQAVIEFDMEGQIKWANDNFCSTVGYELDEMVGRHHRMFVGAEHASTSTYANFWSALRRGEFQAGEFLCYGNGGKEVWLQATYNPVIGPQGKAVKVVKYCVDVTARKQEELDRKAAAENREDMLFGMIEGSAASLMACDENRVITYANPANRALLTRYAGELSKKFPGIDPENLVGEQIDVFHQRPSHQAGLIAGKRGDTFDGSAAVEDLRFGINLTVLKDRHGNHMGAAAEWIDHNPRIKFGRHVDLLVEHLHNGELSYRIPVGELDEDFQPMAESLNRVADTLVTPMRDMASTIGEISTGALPPESTDAVSGEFAEIQSSLNGLIRASREISNTAQAIAAGDLTIAVEPRSDGDELMMAMRDMVDAMNKALGQVRDASSEITSGAMEMNSSTETVATNNQRSAASLEEIGATLVQIGSQVLSNAGNAKQAMELSTTAREHSEDGNKKMEGMVKAMSEIESSSQDVFNIIKVIDEIAFQTNLLALNAAVEAARAGEHGKGFAVVAEEVRNLAERSAKAAKETAEMITDSIRKVSQGSEIAQSTAEVFREIVSTVSQSTELVGDIAAASSEQAHGMEQVNQGLAQLDQVVQGNAASSEEMVSAGQMLLAQTDKLEETLKRFQLKRAMSGAPGEFPPEMMEMFKAFMASQGMAMPAPRAAAKPAPQRHRSQAQDNQNPADLFPLDEPELGRY